VVGSNKQDVRNVEIVQHMGSTFYWETKYVNVGENYTGVEILILILRGLHGKRTVKIVIQIPT